MYKITHFFNHVKHILFGADTPPQKDSILWMINGRLQKVLQ